jgi:hypothetical protein
VCSSDLSAITPQPSIIAVLGCPSRRNADYTFGRGARFIDRGFEHPKVLLGPT